MGKSKSIYLDEEVIEFLKKIAKEEQRSISYYLNLYVREKMQSQQRNRSERRLKK